MMSFAFKSGALEVLMTVVLLSTLVAGEFHSRQKREEGDEEPKPEGAGGPNDPATGAGTEDDDDESSPSETQSTTTSSEPSESKSETSTVAPNVTTTVAGSSDEGNKTTEDPFPDCQKCIDENVKEFNGSAVANAANAVANVASVEDFDAAQTAAKDYCIQQKKCAADRGHLVTPSFYLCIGVVLFQYILF